MDQVTQQGGIKATPSRVVLSDFCSRAKRLSAPGIADLLIEKFAGESSDKLVSSSAAFNAPLFWAQ